MESQETECQRLLAVPELHINTNLIAHFALVNGTVVTPFWNHQLIVDEEAADHLKSIFSMYMDGRNYSDIAIGALTESNGGMRRRMVD